MASSPTLQTCKAKYAGSGGGGDGDRPREWDLLHKGDLKEFSGDRKLYRPWTNHIQAFCNTK